MYKIFSKEDLPVKRYNFFKVISVFNDLMALFCKLLSLKLEEETADLAFSISFLIMKQDGSNRI